MTTHFQKCGMCQQPMRVAAGTLAYFHKECRKSAREQLARERRLRAKGALV